jgi:MFS family permease
MLLQLVFGLSPFASGLLTFASAAGAMLMKVTAPPIIRRLGFRSVLIGNGILSAFIMMSYALFSPTTAHYVIVLALLTGGFFRSLQFTALGTLAYADVPNSSMSGASTLSSMAQQLFLSLGVALGAMLLHLSLTAHGGHLTTSDFTPAFVVMGVLALLSSLLFIPLEYHAGAEVSGRRSSGELSRTPQTVTEAD